MILTHTYPVFISEDGNQFIFPGLYECVETGKQASWEVRLLTRAALNLELRPEDLEVTFEEDSGSIPIAHVPITITHSGFAHGAEEVYLIGGPLFDQAISQQDQL